MELNFQKYPRDHAPTSDNKILFLHGMGGTGALWRPIAAVLEDEMWIMAPDQRGHGKSRPVYPVDSGFTPMEYGQDLVDTLESQNFHPTWVVGHSMGVRSAVALAHLKPDWVKGLVLVDLGLSGPAGGGLGDDLARFLRQLPESFPTRAEARAFMTANCPDASIAQYLMAVSALDPQGQVYFPFDHASLIATIDAARDSSVREWLLELAAQASPILVLRGALSSVWTHEEFMTEKANFQAYPSVIFEEFEGASHGLPFEKRVQFVERLRKFVGAP